MQYLKQQITGTFYVSREPEFKIKKDNTTIANLYLYSSELWHDKKINEVNIKAVAFGTTADYLINVSKGDLIYIAGFLINNNYKNRDGKTVYQINIYIKVASRIDNRKDKFKTLVPKDAERNLYKDIAKENEDAFIDNDDYLDEINEYDLNF